MAQSRAKRARIEHAAHASSSSNDASEALHNAAFAGRKHVEDYVKSTSDQVRVKYGCVRTPK